MTAKVPPPLPRSAYAQARPILLPAGTRLHLVLVGCGGTGSWLAPTLARLAAVLTQAGRPVRLTFIDPDHVEAGNVPRQNFCHAEIGAAKAAALALRYSRAWGVAITTITEAFTPHHVTDRYQDELLILCGAVDNAAARRSLAAALKLANSRYTPQNPPLACWLDCGNAADTGQVLFGNALEPQQLTHAFTPSTVCRAVPAPSLQCPQLLEDTVAETASARLSCTQLLVLNAQSLVINQAVATAAGALLQRLLIAGDLRIFATYVDLATGVQKSDYTTPAAIRRFAKPARPEGGTAHDG